MAATHHWPHLPGYQPSTSSAIYWGKSGWVLLFFLLLHVSAVKKSLTFFAVYASLQVLESKLAACRNFTKDQRARKAYALDNSNVLNGNTTSQTSQSLHTSYFEKAWVKASLVPVTFPWCLTHVVMRIWFNVFNVAELTYVKLPCLLFPTEQRWSLSPCSVWVIAAFPTLIWVCWLFFLLC